MDHFAHEPSACQAHEIRRYEVFRHVLDRDLAEVTDKARFIDDLGADSLDITELLMALEEEFEIEIDDEANQIETVKNAVDYITTKL